MSYCNTVITVSWCCRLHAIKTWLQSCYVVHYCLYDLRAFICCERAHSWLNMETLKRALAFLFVRCSAHGGSFARLWYVCVVETECFGSYICTSSLCGILFPQVMSQKKYKILYASITVSTELENFHFVVQLSHESAVFFFFSSHCIWMAQETIFRGWVR